MAEQQISKGGNCEALVTGGASVVTAKVYHGVVSLTPTVACWIRQGDAPVALATGVDQYLAAGAIYEYACRGKIAAITAGSAGVLYITPLG